MDIRSYISTDIIDITGLMEELGYPTNVEEMAERMKYIEKNDMYETFVAVVNDKVVGMIGLRLVHSYESDKPMVQISALVTNQEYRGKSIGKSLVNYAEEWARS
jgi:GNAT superfamily N-acetyltransferase